MTGIFVGWLSDAARLTGYPVMEVAGWRTRGHGGMRVVEGVIGHHTADGPGEYPSLAVVRDGRADLAGPLANFGLGRSGTIYVIAAGCCWHAGASAWAGFTDLNDEFLGIEAESKGTIDDWTDAQRDAYPRLVAACLYYMNRAANRFAGHREVALPAGRKIDPAFLDMTAMRSMIATMLVDPLSRIPKEGSDPMPGIDEYRSVLREELAAALKVIAKRDDVGWARSQILAALGTVNPAGAPPAPPAGSKPIQQQLDEIRSLCAGILAQITK